MRNPLHVLLLVCHVRVFFVCWSCMSRPLQLLPSRRGGEGSWPGGGLSAGDRLLIPSAGTHQYSDRPAGGTIHWLTVVLKWEWFDRFCKAFNFLWFKSSGSSKVSSTATRSAVRRTSISWITCATPSSWRCAGTCPRTSWTRAGRRLRPLSLRWG